MNQHVAEKLYDELFVGGCRHYLTGTPLSECLRQQARRHRGATQRMLSKFAELPDLNARFEQYIKELQP